MSLAALLGLALADERWRLDARCVEHPDLDWFPLRGDQASIKRAKQVCACCLVRAECLDYALTHRILIGVWGGTTERQRRGLRRDYRGEGSAAATRRS